MLQQRTNSGTPDFFFAPHALKNQRRKNKNRKEKTKNAIFHTHVIT